MEPKNLQDISAVSVFGLGKLGSPMLAGFASKGYRATGFDIMPASVEAMKAHRAPVVETGLQELIDKSRANISATSDYNEAVMKSDVSFIVVPTPSNSDGG